MRMRYPIFWSERFKYILWRIITPFHPLFHTLFLKMGFFRYSGWKSKGRQEYLLGHVAKGETPQSLITHLHIHGYHDYNIASHDKGEVMSLRRLSDFNYQYHIRIFEDGEVRGHYEFTPEAHPFRHHRGEVFEPRREEFLSLLGKKIKPQ